MTDQTREIHCRRTVNDGKDRCPWRGPVSELEHHAQDTADDPNGAHRPCIVCHQSLADDERQTCTRCTRDVDDDLADIVDIFATLPDVIQSSALHTGALPGGNALVLLADGSVSGGGPDDDIKYHDPLLVLATLHVIWERDWRETFGHEHYPRWQATVTSTVAYLRTWVRLAARTHEAFDDFAQDVHVIRRQLDRTAGRADNPASANADCTRCGGRLERAYRPPRRDDRVDNALRAIDRAITPVREQRHAEATYGLHGHELTPWPGPWQQRAIAEPVMRGADDEGLDDTAVCADCGHTYTSGEYRIALRLKALAAMTDWITVAAAASLLERPQQTVWTWVRRMEITSACRVSDRRLVVDADTVKKRARRKSQSEEGQCA